jgi:hypothetical protein
MSNSSHLVNSMKQEWRLWKEVGRVSGLAESDNDLTKICSVQRTQCMYIQYLAVILCVNIRS